MKTVVWIINLESSSLNVSLSLSQMSKQTPIKLWDFNGNLLNVGFIFEI